MNKQTLNSFLLSLVATVSATSYANEDSRKLEAMKSDQKTSQFSKLTNQELATIALLKAKYTELFEGMEHIE